MARRSHRLGWLTLLATTLLAVGSGWLSASAFAQTEKPGWEIAAQNFPTNLAPGHIGMIDLEVVNVGAGSSSGIVTVVDTLPKGVTAIEAGDGELGESYSYKPETFKLVNEKWKCTGNGSGIVPHVAGATTVTCTNPYPFLGGAGYTTTSKEPSAQTEIAIKVKTENGAGEDLGAPEENHATVSGGGASVPASTTDPVTISSQPAPFGFTGLDVLFSNADGTLDTQAGSHPYAAKFTFGLSTNLEERGDGLELYNGKNEARDIEVELPPGFVGDPTAVPQCSREDFIKEECPNDTQIGFITIETFVFALNFRVFNIVPPPGVPADFAFKDEGIGIFLESGVRSGTDYGITTHINNVPQREMYRSSLTLWGIPGEQSHDLWREAKQAGTPCSPEEVRSAGSACSEALHPYLKPLLTLPTSCGAPQKFTIRTTSWEHPEAAPIETSMLWHDANDTPTGLTGCEHVGFSPTITTAPDTANADTPAGLTVEVKPSVGGLLDPNGLSTSDIQDTTVTLPQGVAINPGQAAGLQACPETEETLKANNEAPVCPNASRVGTVEIETPVLTKPLQGDVYVLQHNPPELKLLITASGEGVNLKLIGTVHLNEETGQLVTTFTGTPELPFTSFKLAFSGGAQAALATPTQCGTYVSTSDFTAWASPFVADAFPTSSFQITSGTDGAPCPSNPLPFTPSMIAGSTTDQAGGYTDFSLLLQAPDDQQRIGRLQFKTPEGLLGMISKVPLCTNAQAEANACPEASQIGHTVVASGPGPYPLVIPQPGQSPAPIYLTEGYEGAPYGLSIVVPLHVGPFVLPTQRVRAKIEVDSLTSRLTVTTDPLPQVVGGVPTDLRSIDAVVDRPGFMFNPTSCAPMSFSGTAYSAQGASAPISSHFQMGSCQALKFDPDFKVSTSGKTSRKNGASLDAKIIYPTKAFGANQASSQANIRSVKVDLPKQLPSRLTTLQKACPSQTFEANPANCPTNSKVGSVAAVTPVLPVALSGPAYFVSYGGAKFPELVFVLQGFGVTIYVHGETFINKAGITSSTFRSIPDVPITSFELNLPEGPYSALAANGNLCTSKLKMPTAFTGQNGATLNQTTPISVTGCGKQKAKKVKVKKKKAKKK
jgi:hypothetical protein